MISRESLKNFIEAHFKSCYTKKASHMIWRPFWKRWFTLPFRPFDFYEPVYEQVWEEKPGNELVKEYGIERLTDILFFECEQREEMGIIKSDKDVVDAIMEKCSYLNRKIEDDNFIS
jgi:hypothetical protein